MKQLEDKAPVAKFAHVGKKLVLSWDKVDGADEYEVEILFKSSSTSGLSNATRTEKIAGTSINVDNLMPDTFPYLSARVRALVRGKEGPWSALAKRDDISKTETDSSPPAPPPPIKPKSPKPVARTTTEEQAPSAPLEKWKKFGKHVRVLSTLIIAGGLLALVLWLCLRKKQPASQQSLVVETPTQVNSPVPPTPPPAASVTSEPKEKEETEPQARPARRERPVVINKFITIVSNSGAGAAIAINNGKEGQVMANVYGGGSQETSEKITRTNDIPIGMNDPNPSDTISPGENVLYNFPPGWTIRPIFDPPGYFDIRPVHSSYDNRGNIYLECGGIMVHMRHGYNGPGRVWFHPTAERRGR